MRILIVDDQTLFRQGLSVLLQALLPPAEVIERGSRDSLIDLAAAPWHADLALVSASRPGRDRLALLQQARLAFPDAVLVLLAGVDDDALLHPAIEAGAAGYIPCSIDPASSMTALQQVLDQGIYLAPDSTAGEPRPGSHMNDAALAGLSAHERRLLRALLQGRSAAARALLGGSESELHAATARLWERLSVSGRVPALFRVARPGFVRRLFGDLPPWHGAQADAG